MRLKNLALVMAVGLVVLPATAARASISAILTTEHADIGIGYEDGQWDLHVHDDTNDVEYEPDEVLLYVGPAAVTNRPASAAFNFIGVGPGEQYWRLPQSQNPALLYLGVAADEVESGAFASWNNTDPRVNQTGAYVILSLVDVRGPGDFSIWSSTDDGPVVWMATSDGIDAEDALYQLVGGHSHYNYGFTATGLYEVDFQATAYLGPGATNPTSSDVVTYYFGVEYVPEPSSFALAGCGGLSLAGLALRRRIAGAGRNSAAR